MCVNYRDGRFLPFFFFQAEDGIRDLTVTGVQTCALPISMCGPVINENDLVAALESGRIAGAALDVFEKEPAIHPGLRRANVVLAPHIASASLETRTKMACMAAENVVALLQGRRPANILNPEALKGEPKLGANLPWPN